MKSAITLYALFLTASALVFGASAAAADAPRQRVVQYSDLNLNHPLGVEKLYKRIAAAARAVCGPATPVAVEFIAANKKCRAEAIAVAVQDVNNSNLTAYHRERTGAIKERFATRH